MLETIIVVGRVLLVILAIEALLFGVALMFMVWAISRKEGEEDESTGLSETVEED